MSEYLESSLTFSLEETVRFKKGQEVDELISISLDPHISILEEGNFVILKGSLQLNGEYRRRHMESVDAEELYETGSKYVQSVDSREGESHFTHHFPVDITIPKKRVRSAESIVVQVESFDYHLPESARLVVEASVQIDGLVAESEENMERPAVMAEEVEDEVDAEAENELEESIPTFRDAVEVDEYEEVESYSKPIEVGLNDDSDRSEDVESLQEMVKADAQIAEEDREEQEDPELYIPFTTHSRRLPVQESFSGDDLKKIQQMIPQLPELTVETLAQFTRNYFPDHDMYHSESHYEQKTMEMESSSSSSSVKMEESDMESVHEEKQKDKKKKDKYKSMSFADFFARKEDESSTKLRLCLIQQGETLDQLANKYSISTQQILRANQLDSSSEVSEGQAIYIPIKQAQRK